MLQQVGTQQLSLRETQNNWFKQDGIFSIVKECRSGQFWLTDIHSTVNILGSPLSFSSAVLGVLSSSTSLHGHGTRLLLLSHHICIPKGEKEELGHLAGVENCFVM